MDASDLEVPLDRSKKSRHLLVSSTGLHRSAVAERLDLLPAACGRLKCAKDNHSWFECWTEEPVIGKVAESKRKAREGPKKEKTEGRLPKKSTQAQLSQLLLIGDTPAVDRRPSKDRLLMEYKSSVGSSGR